MTTSMLFVCSGNICRSPSAEAVMRARDTQSLTRCDSCGLEQFHVGEPIDARARQLLLERDIPCETIRARKLTSDDFRAFDWILAMDRGHLAYLQAHAPQPCAQKHDAARGGERCAALALFLDKTEAGAEVRDPYYGDKSDFRRMLDDIEQGVRDWLDFFAQEKSRGHAQRPENKA